MDIIHLFLFRDIVKEVKSLCLTRLQKKYIFYFHLFRFTLFTRLFILYASLRNNVYGMFLYVGQCKCAFIEHVKASKMHLHVVFSEGVLGISAGIFVRELSCRQ